ncbi:hypothetical protein [Micromonospora sp. NPDC050200]|uniref:hypothetical protein n=1 Tax=Micromonospora sp. NPDC050200 TaxID=3155664 RepID=UPI0033C00314
MDGTAEARPGSGARHRLAAVVAALPVGYVLGTRGFSLLYAPYAPAGQGRPVAVVALAPAVLLLALGLTVLASRVAGWWLATAGVLLVGAADVANGDAADAVTRLPATALSEALAVLAGAAGVGLAVGGTLLGLVQLTRPLRHVGTAALAVGVALAPLGALPVIRGPDPSAPVLDWWLWLAVLAVLGATVVLAGGSFLAEAPARHPRIGAVLVIGVAAGSTVLAGALGRSMMDDVVADLAENLRRPLPGSPSTLPLLAVALLTALLLLGYAARTWGVDGVRQVAVGLGLGPATLLAFPYVVGPSAVPFLVLSVLVILVGTWWARRGGTVAGDAVGLLVVAAAGVVADAVNAFRGLDVVNPAQVGVAAVGAGLSFGYGLTRSALRPEPPGESPVGLLAVWVAALLTNATTLLPFAYLAAGTAYRGVPVPTMFVLVGVVGVLVAVLAELSRRLAVTGAATGAVADAPPASGQLPD